MSVTDEVLNNNENYVADFAGLGTPAPTRHLAIVACMDARLDLFASLGLQLGDAHIIRNAGGVVTDDVIRSLTISQRLLGTQEVILIHHTNCGLLGLDDEQFAQQLADDTGERPTWSAHGFSDVDHDVRLSMTRIRNSPFIRHTESVRGFVFDVGTGALREVQPAS